MLTERLIKGEVLREEQLSRYERAGEDVLTVIQVMDYYYFVS